MWDRLYSKLYTLIGGRPWTYITRDWFFKEKRTSLVVLALVVGWVAGALFPWWGLPVLGTGFVLGHILWGGRRSKVHHDSD